MTTIITLRQSNVPGRVPTTGQLEFGEVAVNTADGKLYLKNYEFQNQQSFAVSVVNNGSVDWTVSGDDRSGPISGQDIAIQINTGDTIVFTNNASAAHPLYIKTAPTTGTGDQVTGATGQGASGGGTVTWTPTVNQTGIYYYQCSSHADMVGTIVVSDGSTQSIVEFSADPQDILNLIKTVDGANSGLDADLLDGQSGDYYLDYNNFTNVPPATFDLTLSGKVTGTAFSNTGVMTLVTELANTGVTPGTYGTASQIPIITIDEDGRITSAGNTAVAGVDDFFYTNSNNTLTILTGDGSSFLANLDRNRTVTLAGDVTGTVTTTTDTFTVTTDIANTGVTPGTYGTASQIPIVTVARDGRITSIANTAVAGVENFTWLNANNTLRLETGDGTVRFVNVDDFTNLNINGNITVSGTVDGRDVLADGIKLDGIEANATGDMTATEILNAIKTVDGTTSGLDADRLDGQEGSYYLDYNNINNTPTANDVLNQIKTVDGIGSGLDADRLDGQEGSYYLDYTNFTNTAALLTDILSIDGSGTGIDADLLDGLHAQDILDQAANSAAAATGDADITITAGDALTGGGTFNVNQFLDQEITINHADTSSQASVDNSGGNVIQDITLDTYGHVTGIGSADLDLRYLQLIGGTLTGNLDVQGVLTATTIDRNPQVTVNLSGDVSGSGNATLTNLQNGTISITTTIQPDSVALGTDTTGDYVESISNTAGIVITGTTGEGAVQVIGHADTSSITDITGLATKEVISELTFDTFGHVQTSATKTLDFISQTEADLRYVNVTGDTMTGELEVQDDIVQDFSRFVSRSASSALQFPTTLLQFSSSTYGGAELTIVAESGGDRHITKLLITHDGSTAVATEYGEVTTNSELFSADVSISSGNVNLFVLPAAANPTSYKVFGTLII